MKISIVNDWQDHDAKFYELRLNIAEACCVKENRDGLCYILECDNGYEVYSWIGGADFPLRKLTKEETKEILDYVNQECKFGLTIRELLEEDFKCGEDLDLTSWKANADVYIFWHTPGLNVSWYPLVQIDDGEGNMIKHREFGENPDYWVDNICDLITECCGDVDDWFYVLREE